MVVGEVFSLHGKYMKAPPPPPSSPYPPPPLPIQSALKIWVFCHDIVSKGVLITVSNFQSPYWKLIDFHIQVTTEIGNNEKYWDGPNLNTCVHCTVTVYSISQSSDLLYKMPKCYFYIPFLTAACSTSELLSFGDWQSSSTVRQACQAGDTAVRRDVAGI